MAITRNGLAVIKNPYQGNFHRVLCVCSAGCLRSPTAAVVLAAEPYNFNTRAAGVDEEYAIIPVTETLLEWADEIVCMDDRHAQNILARLKKIGLERKPVKVLGIPDDFEYRNPELIEFIKNAYDKVDTI